MLENIKMAVLDMAGTTVDEQNVVYKTLLKAIKSHDVDTDLPTVLAYGAGKEKHQAIKDVLHAIKSDKIAVSDLIFEDFKLMLKEAYDDLDVKPIQGVEKTLKKLRENKIIVVLNTGYNREVASKLLQKLGWIEGKHFDMLITASDVVLGRPHPEMIERAMENFEITDPQYVLKAGDSVIDIEEGKNAQCGITIGVLSGAQTAAQLEEANPSFILPSLSELEI